MLAFAQDFARFAAAGILNSLFAGIAIALLAAVVTRLARQQGSATRFTVWFLALIVIVLLPWVGSVGTSSRLAAPTLPASAITLPASMAFYLVAVWIVGAGFGLARVAFSLYRLQRLRSTCTPVDVSQLDPSLVAILGDRRSHRRVTLCTSDIVRVPAAIGYFRPMVVFPSWVLKETPTADLRAILLHELAHLRRWDDWTNLAQKLVKALFFFHPAVWFIESRLTLEREMACDDAVLAANFSPRAYAESLVGLAERSFLRHGIQLAQAAVSHARQLKMRLAQILHKDRVGQGSGSIGKPAFALMVLVGLVSTCALSRAPRLIAFSSDVPSTGASASTSLVNSLPPSSRLQPVSLTHADHGGSLTTIHKSDPVRRSAHRLVLSPRIDLNQRMARFQVTGEEIAPPMLVLSNFRRKLAPTPVLVIFQGEQFGVNGPVLWRVTVLHLTPAQQRALAGGFPKQI